MYAEINELFKKTQELLGKVEAKALEQAAKLDAGLDEMWKKIDSKFKTDFGEVGPNRKIQIKVNRIKPGAKLPTYAHTGPRGDMAADIYAIEDHTIKPGELYKAPTGLILQPPAGYGFKIRERSSQWFKTETMVGAGLGDPGYANEYFIGIKNLGNASLDIKAGDRIAQIQVIERIEGDFSDDSSFEDTDRKGGIGSTGK